MIGALLTEVRGENRSVDRASLDQLVQLIGREGISLAFGYGNEHAHRVLDVGTHRYQLPDVVMRGTDDEGRVIDEQPLHATLLRFFEHRENFRDVAVAAGKNDIVLRDEVEDLFNVVPDLAVGVERRELVDR